MIKCPYCQAKMRGWTPDEEVLLEIGLCPACGELLAIESGGATRKLTDDEQVACASREDVQITRRLWLDEQENSMFDAPVFEAYEGLHEAAKAESIAEGTRLVYETIYFTAAVRTYETIQQMFAKAGFKMPPILVNRLMQLGKALRMAQNNSMDAVERTPPDRPRQRRRGGLRN